MFVQCTLGEANHQSSPQSARLSQKTHSIRCTRRSSSGAVSRGGTRERQRHREREGASVAALTLVVVTAAQQHCGALCPLRHKLPTRASGGGATARQPRGRKQLSRGALFSSVSEGRSIMSIYDDDDAGGGGDIYSGSDELVVP